MSKWNLSVFYPNDDAWKEDLSKIAPYAEKLAAFRGKLGNYEDFLAFYKLDEELEILLYNVYGYIHLASDLNLKNSDLSQKLQMAMLEFAKVSQATSYVSPELIAIGKETIDGFLEKDAFLATHRFSIERLFYQQKHVLSELEEKILVNFQPTQGIPSNLYQALSIVDAKNETIVLSDGSEKVITGSNYRALIADAKTPSDRKKIFEAAFKRYADHKTAFAHIYNLVLQNKRAHYQSRHFDSALESALFSNQIPLSVFHNLKDVAYENTHLIKRYLKLRQKHLNLETYHTYDRFVPLAKDDTKYPYDKAKKLFIDAISHFDKEFVENQIDAVKDGYVDAYPGDGKRTGAYSSGFYGHHPFILLNHDETMDSVFTLAHEAGHSAHTIFSNGAQPRATSSYTIFVAEIASTFNEHALLDYLLKTSTTKSQKIALIENAIDGIMSTFFRQTLFATYEFEASEMVRKGLPITADSLSKIMIDLYKHYYDLDIVSEDYKQYVWAYIPHLFHTPFYVYQYATSYSASLKIYADVKANKKDAMKHYKDMLKSGGSDYPVKLAAKAGADLTNKETFLAVINRFESLIDELEKVLAS